MKAFVTTDYGPPEVLKLKDIDKPKIGDKEVLIKMKAATVTAGDCELRRFDIPLPIIFWLPLRIVLGIFKPRKNLVQGQEMAGEIVEVGKEVANYKVGDKVFGGTGFSFGAYAEYKKQSASYPMGIKPESVSWGDAATLVVGGVNALHFLRMAKIKPGQKVLIYGSTGSIGTYAVQIAKYYGAEVTAVGRKEMFEEIKSAGADHVLDYRTDEYYPARPSYDVILEAVGKSSFSAGLKALKDRGTFILCNPKIGQMFHGTLLEKFDKKRVIFKFAGERTEDLNFLANLMAEGKIQALIGKTFKLDQLVEAHKYVEEGHKDGNVVIEID